jgi:hypothetical protein
MTLATDPPVSESQRRAMRAPTEVEKAYIAGIVDGEGCIGAAEVRDKRPGRGPGVMFTIFVAMTDRQAVDLLQELYGGHVREKIDARNVGRRPCFCWQGYGEIGARLIRDVLPYLRIKNQQALTYLDARTTFTGGPRKGVQGSVQPSKADVAKRFECLRRIQALNQRLIDVARA